MTNKTYKEFQLSIKKEVDKAISEMFYSNSFNDDKTIEKFTNEFSEKVWDYISERLDESKYRF
jgi:hypothetical protein